MKRLNQKSIDCIGFYSTAQKVAQVGYLFGKLEDAEAFISS
jgi:hypothetical protein